MLETIQTIASIANPLVLLLLGWWIKRNLERTRQRLAAEREWLSKWADAFYEAAVDFDSSVSKCITLLFERDKNREEELDGWKKRDQTYRKEINDFIYNLQSEEWNIQKYLDFAPQHGDRVMEKQKALFESVRNLLRTGRGDLEEIREKQFEFNAAVRDAHSEMLSQADPGHRKAT